MSASAHVLVWLVSLIDYQQSDAGFYILITVSAGYWSLKFSNMVDSDRCNILHFHSSFSYSNSLFVCQTLSQYTRCMTYSDPCNASTSTSFSLSHFLCHTVFPPFFPMMPFLWTLLLFWFLISCSADIWRFICHYNCNIITEIELAPKPLATEKNNIILEWISCCHLTQKSMMHSFIFK